jgi:pimeloyl-ACP methyl ester carboxylesterase
MLPVLAKPIDHISLRLATMSVRDNGSRARGNEKRLNISIAALQRLEAWAREPETFFAPPKVVPDIFRDSRPVSVTTDCERRGFEFSSECASPWRRNNTVRGWVCLTHSSPQSRPTVVILHGWNHGGWQSVYYIAVCRWLAQHGINSVFFDLPHHGSRRLTGHGEPRNFLTDDLADGILAARQAVSDTRQVIRGLRAAGFENLGLWGISLGGWIGALTMAREDSLQFAALTTPAARLDEIIAAQPFAASLRARFAEDGVSLNEAADGIRFLLPKHQRLRLNREQIFLASAQHDQFVSVPSVEELWTVWGRPRIERYAHGHITILVAPRALQDLAEFFARWK